jgi:hypothetical protein
MLVIRRTAAARRATGIGLASVAMVMLAACGGGKPQASPSTSTALAPQTTVSVPPYNPAQNARHDVVAGACVDGGAKGWSLSGTVTNSGSTPRGYSIAVDFITVPGDTVMATKVVNVPTLQPHQSAKWLATGAAPGVKNLTCVIRQSLST